MAKLIVKQEHLQSEIHFEAHGSSRVVILKNATQAELELLKKQGVFDHIFETEKVDKSKA